MVKVYHVFIKGRASRHNWNFMICKIYLSGRTYLLWQYTVDKSRATSVLQILIIVQVSASLSLIGTELSRHSSCWKSQQYFPLKLWIFAGLSLILKDRIWINFLGLSLNAINSTLRMINEVNSTDFLRFRFFGEA